MTITPKVTVEDIRLALNGTYSGSTNEYTFWGQNLSSGSILAQINLSNYYIYGLLGATAMDSTASDTTTNLIRTAELDYSCMRTLVLLSGGVIVDGFNWTVGPTVQQPAMLPTYKNLIAEFKEAALKCIRSLQPIGISEEYDMPAIGHTAPSPY